jgi:hypothetical protein
MAVVYLLMGIGGGVGSDPPPHTTGQTTLTSGSALTRKRFRELVSEWQRELEDVERQAKKLEPA